jgi:hypothetical protein
LPTTIHAQTAPLRPRRFARRGHHPHYPGQAAPQTLPELTEIILGVIGKAQGLYGMAIHAFVLVSTHAHFLLSPSSAG